MKNRWQIIFPNYSLPPCLYILPKLYAKVPRACWGMRRMPTAMMLFAAKVLALTPSLQKASLQWASFACPSRHAALLHKVLVKYIDMGVVNNWGK